MHIILILFFGILLGIITSVLPGMLNMNTVKIQHYEGKKKAYWFLLGVSVIHTIKIYIVYYVILQIGFKEHFSTLIQKLSLPIFVLLTIYFLFFANKGGKKNQEKTKIFHRSKLRHSAFLRGVILCSLNLNHFPFYFGLFSIIRSYGIPIKFAGVTYLTAGIFVGTALAFIGYMRIFNSKSRRVSTVIHNINYIIGGLTGLAALVTLYKMVF